MSLMALPLNPSGDEPHSHRITHTVKPHSHEVTHTVKPHSHGVTHTDKPNSNGVTHIPHCPPQTILGKQGALQIFFGKFEV